MKRIFYCCAAALCLLIATAAGGQSLGDVARQQRQAKHPSAAKVYTNEDIPAVELPPAEAAPATVEDKPSSPDAKSAPEDKSKAAAALRAKADDLKKEIAQLQREYTVSEREYKLRTAVYYADAGNSLRDPKKWAEQERQYQAEMSDKRTAIDTAKQKLTDVEEQARKQGVRIE